MENGKRFVSVSGTDFVKDGHRMLFNGIGIGSWLNMEHYMLGIPGTDAQIRRTFASVFGSDFAEKFFDRFVYDFITEEDFSFLRRHSINLVRVPFDYRLFIDDEDTQHENPKGFAYFDYLMGLARKYGIYVLLDLHSAPGGQNPDWHSDNGTGYTEFWEYDVFRRQVAALWRRIAERYGQEEYLLGYDVLNEPFIIPQLLEEKEDAEDMASGLTVPDAGKLLAKFYGEVIEAIRSADPEHIIFLEGDHFASDFDALRGITDGQTAMEFHFYPTVWYENLYDEDIGTGYRQQKFEEVMQKLIANASRCGRPILCGEAGYEIVTKGFDRTFPLIRDTISLFTKYGLSFTLWSYKDADFMGMVRPKQDSPWMRLCREVNASWDHHAESDRAQAAVARLCDEFFPQATRADRYVLTFRERALLYQLEEKYILQPILTSYGRERIMELPASFRFSECEYYERFADLFTAAGGRIGG
ncbi:MAG: glycoside hydrolase family 5 protein [Lachnospiraceae bacterium]|jgi:endoglucanase|nr:glycoside hydrolase family 5 protein [Lachnospiraceae bacterium]